MTICNKDLKEKLISNIENSKQDLIEISDYLYENPELSFEEYKACEILTSKLAENGFKVEKGIAGLETAFKAVFEGKPGGPKIGILAEYDALPEIGHGCGHNLIATISIGTAIAVSKLMADLEGTLVVFGTPGEEGGGGKVIMTQKGCFNDLDCAMIIHPTNETKVEDISLANENLVYTFYGRSAHAAAFPERGINALDAVIQTFNNINALRGHLEDDIRVHGIITKGGTATNIVTDLAQAKFSIRSLKRKTTDLVVEKINKCAEAAALATGARLEITKEGYGYDEIRNNNVLISTLKENFITLGEPVHKRTIEEGMGSTDMGNVTHVVPGFQSYIGIGEDLATHTIEFAEVCGSEGGHKALLTATQAFGMTAIDLLTKPEILKEAKIEFESKKED